MTEYVLVVVCPKCHSSECAVTVEHDPTNELSIHEIFVDLSYPKCQRVYDYFDLEEFTLH